MKNKKTPAIRFKGFTDDWEQRKLGDVFEEYSEKGQPEFPAMTIVQGGGTVRRDESDRNLQYDKASLANYKVVYEEDFIVHLRSFEGGLEKATALGIISPAYHTFHGNGTDSRFYYVYFRSPKFIDHDLKPHVYGIRDGRSIDIEGMKTIEIPWTNFKEQISIGNFIDNLNGVITLHQRKLEKLKNFKKAMLEKMFPKNGEKIPEIRFQGFTDDWEQRKLGDVAEIGDIDHRMPSAVSFGVPYLMTGDFVGVNELNFDGVKQISEEDYEKLSKKIKPEKGDILFARYASVGAVRYVDFTKKFLISYSCAIIKSSKKINSRFLYYFLTSNVAQKQILSEIKTGSQANIGIDVMKNNIIIPVLALDEQKKLSIIFKKIDCIITLHQRKLEVYFFI